MQRDKPAAHRAAIQSILRCSERIRKSNFIRNQPSPMYTAPAALAALIAESYANMHMRNT